MGCVAECSPTIDDLVLGSCTQTTMQGGIRALAFLKCDASFDDVSGGISAVSAWESLVASSDLYFTGPILGSKPKGAVTSLRTQSCSPEVPVARTQTLQFSDFNADTENFTHYDFWESIRANYGTLKLLYISCEGYVYGPFDNKTWTIDLDDVRNDTNEQPLFMDGTITITKLGLTKPVFVDGLIDILP